MCAIRRERWYMADSMTITSGDTSRVLAETTEAGRHSPKIARSQARHAAVELSKRTQRR
jgi:hypothetical protein